MIFTIKMSSLGAEQLSLYTIVTVTAVLAVTVTEILCTESACGGSCIVHVPDVGVGEVRRVMDLVYTGETTGTSEDGGSLRDLLDALGIAAVFERVDDTRRSNRDVFNSYISHLNMHFYVAIEHSEKFTISICISIFHFELLKMVSMWGMTVLI